MNTVSPVSLSLHKASNFNKCTHKNRCCVYLTGTGRNPSQVSMRAELLMQKYFPNVFVLNIQRVYEINN